MKRALMVIVLDPRICAWLQENDPKALQQAREALGLDELIEKFDGPSRSEADDFAALFTDHPSVAEKIDEVRREYAAGRITQEAFEKTVNWLHDQDPK